MMLIISFCGSSDDQSPLPCILSSISTHNCYRPLRIMCASRMHAYGQSHCEKVTSGYDHLQSIVGTGDTKRSNRQTIMMSKEDKDMEAVEHVYMTVTRFGNVAKVLEEYCAIFSDMHSSRTKIAQKSQHLKRYIIPLIKHASSTLEDTGIVLLPIA